MNAHAQPAPDLWSDEFAPVLDALADTLTAPPPGATPTRTAASHALFARVAHSAAAASRLHTTRLADAPAHLAADGVTQRTLYRAADAALPRPGEPILAALVDLTAGAQLEMPADGLQHEWLLLDGDAQVGGSELLALGYLVHVGSEPQQIASRGGARLYRRSSPLHPAGIGTQPAREWRAFGAGIERLLLWQRGREAAMLYRTEPGAHVPLHGHDHDEECLMVSGDLFLDDVLLRRGDYQLAPAGSQHASTDTDTGCILFAHGDVELKLL